MNKYLILEDGTTYPGTAFGDLGAQVAGELVFNTAMTGYQASLTDPSYLNQLLTFTNPPNRYLRYLARPKSKQASDRWCRDRPSARKRTGTDWPDLGCLVSRPSRAGN